MPMPIKFFIIAYFDKIFTFTLMTMALSGILSLILN